MKNTDAIYEGGCVVYTFAGTGEEGYRDGAKSQSQFNDPTSIAVRPNGDLYVADAGNHRLRKISAAHGTVHTIAGTGTPGCKDGPAHDAQFEGPYGISLGAKGTVIATDASSTSLRAFCPSANTVMPLGNTAGDFLLPTGVAVTANGNIHICDTGNSRVVTVRAHGGAVARVVGSGDNGYADGEAVVAQLCFPWGIAVNAHGDLYVSDSGNHCIRKIDARTGTVRTVAGSGEPGWRDGDAGSAQFNDPHGLAVAADGCVYVADARNQCIRKVDLEKQRVVTVAGDGNEGFCDGDGCVARFHGPDGLAMGHDGVLYVVDSQNDRIRAIVQKPESTLDTVTKELQEQKQQRNKLARDIESAAASTIAFKEELRKTTNAIALEKKHLATLKDRVNVTRVALCAALEYQKTQLQKVKRDTHNMKNAKVLKAADNASVAAALTDAQLALTTMRDEKAQYTKELARLDAHLQSATGRGGDDIGVKRDVTARLCEDTKSDHGSHTTDTSVGEDDDPRESVSAPVDVAEETMGSRCIQRQKVVVQSASTLPPRPLTPVEENKYEEDPVPWTVDRPRVVEHVSLPRRPLTPVEENEYEEDPGPPRTDRLQVVENRDVGTLTRILTPIKENEDDEDPVLCGTDGLRAFGKDDAALLCDHLEHMNAAIQGAHAPSLCTVIHLFRSPNTKLYNKLGK